MTEKLYWSDPLASTFEARQARIAAYAGRPSVVLPRTLFYPEGGGQLGDAGTLSIGNVLLSIADTQIDEAGDIHHVLAEKVPEGLATQLGGEPLVRGTIDGTRRLDHAVQHTAQHALSRALADRARASTVSARLGAKSCTVDVARPTIPDGELCDAEDLVNAVIMSDVAVTASFPSDDELAKLDLRKQPNAEKSAAGVRVVSIEGFDVTPCGGTHVSRTGQIGQVRIVSTEKYKGMLRITFVAGRRALADARSAGALLSSASAALSCGALDVPAALAKLRGELKSTRTELDAARLEIASLVAERLASSLPDSPGPHVLPVYRPTDDVSTLRALAGKLARDPRVVAVCGASDPASGELVVVLQRGTGTDLDCGAFMLAQASQRGGRGGGRPDRAEGRFPRGTSLEALAAAAAAP